MEIEYCSQDCHPHDPRQKSHCKSNWQLQQQQQQSISDELLTSSRKLVTDQTGITDVRGYTTDDPTSTRKLVRNPEPPVDKKPQFEIDLRREGVSKDAILQDEAKMNEIGEILEKCEKGSCTKSIRNDLSKGAKRS